MKINIMLDEGQALHLLNMIKLGKDQAKEDYGDGSEEFEFMQELNDKFLDSLPQSTKNRYDWIFD